MYMFSRAPTPPQCISLLLPAGLFCLRPFGRDLDRPVRSSFGEVRSSSCVFVLPSVTFVSFFIMCICLCVCGRLNQPTRVVVCDRLNQSTYMYMYM